MILKTLQIITIILSASCNAFPTDVDDFERLSSNLLKEKTSFKYNISNEMLTKDVNTTLTKSGSPFVSHFIHNGHNFFFKPNIVLGTKIEKSIQDIKEKNKKVKKRERKKKLSTSTNTTRTTAPTTTSMLTENNDKFSSSENREKVEIKTPEQPFFTKPVILKESEPVAQPIEVPRTKSFLDLRPPAKLFPENVEYIHLDVAIHFQDLYLPKGSSVTPALPQYQGTHEKLSDKKPLIPPKSPQIVPLQLPVAVIIISSPETVSKGSMETPNYCIPQVLAEKNHLRKQKDKVKKLPSLPAFWAHNIALARALPKIMTNKEKIYDPYLPH